MKIMLQNTMAMLGGFTFLSILIRMIFSVVCGGLIGIEREYKRRSAGFRTHILICLGASMTTLTGQYLVMIGYYTDLTRFAAQVVAGIGFIGAGTIIVTKNYVVKGLTTAAGLWVTAIIGIAFGAGFLSAGFFATILILIAELWLSKLEYRLQANSPQITLFIEYQGSGALRQVMHYLEEQEIAVLNTEISRKRDSSKPQCAMLSVLLRHRREEQKLLEELNRIPGVDSAEEL